MTNETCPECGYEDCPFTAGPFEFSKVCPQCGNTFDAHLITPLKWTPELVARRREYGLWCIVRWAVRGEDDLYLCGALEVHPGRYVENRSMGALGFPSQGGGDSGFLALFRSGDEVNHFMDQGREEEGRIGPGIAQNHGVPLKCMRFDVRTYSHHTGKSHWWGRDMGYFEALAKLGQARLFEPRVPGSTHSDLELAESIERKWTLAELKWALCKASLGSGDAIRGHRAEEANGVEV